MECISGSHMYGTSTPKSDIDVRGIFKQPNEKWLSLKQPFREVSDEFNDVKFFELRKFFELAMNVNPNILELFFVPEDCLKVSSNLYDELVKHAGKFVTKKCYHSYSSYANAQIKRAKGKNKKVHSVQGLCDEESIDKLRNLLKLGLVTEEWTERNFCKNVVDYLLKKGLTVGEPKNYDWKRMDQYLICGGLEKIKPPVRMDFCHIVKLEDNIKRTKQPFRPSKFTDLDAYDCSSVEHIPNLYRVYKNGSGLFKGGHLKYTSIPIAREWKDFVGVMYYNENEFEKKKKEWLSFWEWMANRNEERWRTQETGEMDYDAKNMMHTVRLLIEAEYIATEGRPRVRMEGDDLRFLMAIREGKYQYEWILKWSEDKCEELRWIFDDCSLPCQVKENEMEQLYKELVLIDD